MSSSVLTPEATPVSAPEVTPVSLKGQRTTVLFGLVLLLYVALATAGFFGWRKLNAINKAQKELQYSLDVTDYIARTDFIQPSVNTIQFLHHGYSIHLASVVYNQDGLVLSGYVGNPTQFWINSLALKFSARPYPYKVQDKWMKDPWAKYSNDCLPPAENRRLLPRA